MACDFEAGAAFGSMPLGSGPFGTETDDPFRLVSVVQVTANQVTAVLAGDGEIGSRLDSDSPLNSLNWTLTSESGTVRLVQWVEDEGGMPRELSVYFDGGLTPGAIYRLALTIPETVETGCYSDEFTSIAAPSPAVPGDAGFPELPGIVDLANPPTNASRIAVGHAYIGSLGYDSAGDLVNDFGIESLRKRIFRRINTAAGGFFHLPNYGTDLSIKQAITPGQLLSVQRRIQEQVLREPDVVRASVSVSRPLSDPAIVSVIVTAQTASGESVTVENRTDAG